jgi:hypothetical protein
MTASTPNASDTLADVTYLSPSLSDAEAVAMIMRIAKEVYSSDQQASAGDTQETSGV